MTKLGEKQVFLSQQLAKAGYIIRKTKTFSDLVFWPRVCVKFIPHTEPLLCKGTKASGQHVELV